MDTTKLVLDVLSEALTVPVSTDMPATRDHARPSRYVLVDLTGDQSDAFILRPRYDLTCWGTSDREARSIAISAVEALQEAAMDHPYLSSCDLETMSREEWDRNGHGRYLAVVQLVINTDD